MALTGGAYMFAADPATSRRYGRGCLPFNCGWRHRPHNPALVGLCQRARSLRRLCAGAISIIPSVNSPITSARAVSRALNCLCILVIPFAPQSPLGPDLESHTKAQCPAKAPVVVNVTSVHCRAEIGFSVDFHFTKDLCPAKAN